jgi:PhzF family phenazine biosynthesis protein
MTLPLFVVNAFTDEVFGGNPAAVVPLDAWLPDASLQAIAAQHNLSETAFIVPEAAGWRLRWFTPGREVDLCGHATLATAAVLHQIYGAEGTLSFYTRSGELRVEIQQAGYQLDFPAAQLEPAVVNPEVASALGCEVLEAARPVDNDWQWVYRVADEATLLSLKPDFRALAAAVDYGVTVTAEGFDCDFVSRFFIPQLAVDEDPVTGSAHCLLTPFWAQRMDKNLLSARQLSQRGGTLGCELRGDRVLLAGRAVLYARGEILPDLHG